ncbi:MAG: hypothetical protein KA149_08065 [Chitinophagales bacterium]|nr:hypothetical protein [Chitinophagales bacterium]
MSQLKLLKRKEVDEQKWNALINASANSLPYALSWYLDAVAENWYALVWNDYEAAMPLVWLTKAGFKCLYQPYYCQQLGIFSKKPAASDLQQQFLNQAKKFAYVNINLNPVSQIVEGDFKLKQKRNLLLNLNQAYPALKKNYTENHRRNIAKAEKNALQFTGAVELKPFQKFYTGNINPQKENFKPQHEKIFKRLSAILINNGAGQVFGVTNSEGELTAAVLLITHGHRLIAIINTSSAEGKRNGASHFLFDRLIHKFSGQPFIFDFEGSSIASIARFYEGFGAFEEVFFNYHTTVLKQLSQLFR